MTNLEKTAVIVAFMNNILNADIETDPFAEMGCDEDTLCNGFIDQDDLERALEIYTGHENPCQVYIGDILVMIHYDGDDIYDMCFLDVNNNETPDDGSVDLLLVN